MDEMARENLILLSRELRLIKNTIRASDNWKLKLRFRVASNLFFTGNLVGQN